jgi:hypothetical protein
MANKFKAGMLNFIEVLNQMWDAFAAGPYNGLPLTGGTLTGPVSSTTSISAATLYATALIRADAGLQVGIPNTEQQGITKVYVANSAYFFTCSGPIPSQGCALSLAGNTATGRSISAGGTVNASGADYAEYLIKGLLCGTIAPGQIVGIDADGKLTDKWDLAVSFAVKSTSPCMVGGDTWAAHLGPRPVEPVRQDGATDEQWALAVAGVKAAQQEFDAALEVARQTVDRIAFAGQVPVNLLGTTPGQFIVPVKSGEGIGGLAVDEGDLTLKQYLRAVGRVIAIEDDGRARIIVKVA